MKLLNPKNSKEIESPFGDNVAAVEALADKVTLGTASDFAKSLYASVGPLIAKSKPISQAQMFWLHALAMPEVAPKPDGNFDLSGLLRMFRVAGESLKKPSILLQTAADREVKLYIAGPTSRHPGNVMVVSRHYGEAYYGRVAEDGSFFPGKDDRTDVRDLLHRMAIAPEDTAREYGRLTGCCCFCSSSLTDARSTEVGYGPRCAEVFGLTWGNKIRNVRA